MDLSRLRSSWEQLAHDTAFRVGTVYAGASWFVIEAADTLGASTSLIRTAAALLAAGFLLVVPTVLVLDRSGRPSRATDRTGARADHPAASASPSPSPDSTSSPPARGSGRRGTGRWATALGVLVALSLGAWWAGARIGAPVPAAATHIAVLPFHATGSEAARELGVGMVDLLSAAMDDVAGIRTVSSRSVLARVSEGAAPLDLDGALDLGRRLEAGSVLTGSVTAVSGRVRLHAEVREVRGGAVLAGAEAEGPEDDVLQITDELAVRLLREMWRSGDSIPTVQTAALTTTSPAALRSYLAGERHLRAMRTDSATHAFRAAVAADSTFALAWLRLTESTGWTTREGSAEGVSERRAYVEQAQRYADRLPARSRALVAAVAVELTGELAALDTLERYVARYPDDPYGWYLLGDARFHAAILGLHSHEQIVEPFLEATRLDPSFALGLVHPIELAIDLGDREQFDRLLQSYDAMAPADRVEDYRREARVRWAPADSLLHTFLQEARALETGAPGPLNLLIGALGNRVRSDASLDPLLYVAAVDSIARAFPNRRAWLLRTEMLAGLNLLALGRVREGFERGDRWLEMLPAPSGLAPDLARPIHRVSRALDHGIPPAHIGEELATLEARTDDHPFLPELLHFYYLTVGEIDSADRFTLSREMPDDLDIDTTALRLANDGWSALLRGDSTRALSNLDEAIRRTGFRDFGVVGSALLPYAQLLASRAPTRDRGIRMLHWFTLYSAADVGPAFLYMARALEDAGRTREAREAYAHVVRLWEDADDYRQPAVQESRAALVRLTSET
jgi:TolB-like protein